jgi:hypothetical membrane protein
MSGPAALSWLFRHPVANSESRESAALLVAAAVFLVGAVVAAIVFHGHDVPIAGPGSVGQFVALASAVAAVGIFVATRAVMRVGRAAGTLLDPGPLGGGGQLRWYDIGAIAIAHGVISLLLWLAVAGLLSRSFIGAVVFPVPATLLASVAIAVTAYSVFLSAVGLTPILMSVVLVVFVAAGTFASMLSASDPSWWQANLSALGISDDISALAFNLTVVIAGIIVTTLAHYATAAIPTSTPEEVRGRARVRGSLVLIGVLLACVGIFPVDQYSAAHNVSATGMLVVFIGVVIRLRRWIPAIANVFLLLGYIYVGVLVVLAMWFVTGYYTLTAVELVAFLVIFSWLIVFLRQTGAMVLAENEIRVEGTYSNS